MKLKEKMKRFWTLNVHNHEGFTLVELIIVIAILAILSSVAVVGYSAYIKKANLQADRTLISEVKNAFELYYYSSNGEVEVGYVILGKDGVVDADEFGEAALRAAYGDGWDKLSLKHDGWKGESSTLSYRDSSYYGKESSLIDTVDSLTTALGDVIEQDANLGNALIGGNFKTFLDDYDVDTTNGKAVGNAAVLYVAQNTKGKEAEIKAAVYAGLGKGGSSLAAVSDNIYNELVRTGIGDAAAMAVVYAYTEGYVQYSGQADKFNPDFGSVSGADAAQDAMGALADSLNALDATSFDAYVTSGQMDKDLQGYIGMMGTVHNNKDVVSGNLSADDCFTDGTVENMLKGHAAMSNLGITTTDNQVAIVLVVDGNGNVIIHVTPINWNK